MLGCLGQAAKQQGDGQYCHGVANAFAKGVQGAHLISPFNFLKTNHSIS